MRTSQIFGRCWIQGRAFSNEAAAWKTDASSNGRPTICNPIGTFVLANPQGTVAAGRVPRMLNGKVVEEATHSIYVFENNKKS